jgi:hypothetical protein
MKTEFIIIGISKGCGYVWNGSEFVTLPWDEAKRFASRSVANRAIDRLFAAGEKMEMGSIAAPPISSQALGRLAAGVKKTISPEESAARAARLAAARKSRWAK